MTEPRRIAGYGWRKDLPDPRDRIYNLEHEIKQAAQLPAVADLEPNMPPIYDQGALGSCFPAGTLIRMEDGSERPIDDVRLGEYVLTAEGRPGMVRQTMLRLETDGLIRLSLWGYSALRLTAEHPVLTKRGYVAAGELAASDFVGLPRYAPLEREHVEVGKLLSKPERTIKAGVRKMGVLHGRADIAVRVASLPERIALTPRFGRLVGLFLAEGSTDSGKVRWTFGAHEAETLVLETVDLLCDLGVEAHVQHRANNSINVVVYGTAWARLWERLCGTGSGEKALNPVLAGDDEFCRGVLEGWLAGDGYCRRRGNSERRVGSSVSKRLALAMYDIAQHLGLRPALRYCKAKTNDAANHRRNFYEVDISAKSDNWRCEQAGDHVWRKVREIQHEDFAGFVYNLSVEGDESYVAEGVGVHNCTANAAAALLEYRQMQQFEGAHTPSRLFVYYEERRLEGSPLDQDTGAEVRTGIKVLVSEGAPLETDWPYDIARFGERPPDACYQSATTREATAYKRIVIGPGAPMRTALAAGLPIAFGFTVPDYFETYDAATEMLALPGPNPRFIGGHAVVIVGYDYSRKRFPVPVFKVRNSWGPGFGERGYFHMDARWFDPFRNLADDLWIVSKTT